MFSFIVLIALPYFIAFGSLENSELAAVVVAITYSTYCVLDYLLYKMQGKLREAYEKLVNGEESE